MKHYHKTVRAAVMAAMAIQALPVFAEKFDIPAQSAASALNIYAKQTNTALVYNYSELAEIETNALVGDYGSQQALQLLVAGTGLVITRQGETVTVQMTNPGGMPTSNSTGAGEIEKRATTEIEEMIVTATKREARLQDTAMSITAISGDVIEKRGLTQMGDYLSTLPGVTMQDRGGIGNSIVIRGIAVQPQIEKAAVGAYFGETPVSDIGVSGSAHADLKMVDIERVEVLRGPQGTLFGSGSMGGTLRILPAGPDLDQLEGQVSGQYSRTGKSGGNNSVLKGMLNVPILDNQLAIRAVAYQFDQSGYIENIAASYTGPNNVVDLVNEWGGSVQDQSDVGNNTTTGARVSVLWQPTDKLEFTLGYTWQEFDQQGLPETNPDLPGIYQQARTLPGPNGAVNYFNGQSIQPESNYAEIGIANFTVDYDLGWGKAHSTSSWVDSNRQLYQDFTQAASFLGNWWGSYERENDFFAQEVRFTSEFDGPLQFLAGFYYENRKWQTYSGADSTGDLFKESELAELYGASNEVPADAPDGFTWADYGLDISYIWDNKLKQTAWFGEVSYDISDQFVATLGMRSYEYEQSTFSLTQGFWYSALTPAVFGDVAADNKGQTYKFNLSWKPSDDTLIYFQWAEGFRPGEAITSDLPQLFDPENTGFYTAEDGTKIPIRTQTDPDTLENFELGLKTSLADNRILLNFALYRINWQGLPVRVRIVNLVSGGFGSTTTNAGESTSEGAELESTFLLTENLRLDLGASYNEALLAKDQAGLGKKGDDLPGSAAFNLSAGLEYAFDISGYDAFARVDYTYLSEFDSLIAQDDSLPSSGGYGQIHLKSGVSIGQFDLDLFVRNLTNEDDITWASSNSFVTTVYRLRPRTIGLNLAYHF